MMRILPFIVLGLFLAFIATMTTGCVELVGGISETNKHIATANENRFKAFAAGMVGCGENAACQVALAMGFAGNMGNQPYMRPDTVLDWIRAVNQPLDTILRYTDKRGQEGGGGAMGSLVLKGDQNVVNVGNSSELRGNGNLHQDLSTSAQPYKEQRTWTQDGQSQGNGTTDRHDAPVVAPAEVQ